MQVQTVRDETCSSAGFLRGSDKLGRERCGLGIDNRLFADNAEMTEPGLEDVLYVTRGDQVGTVSHILEIAVWTAQVAGVVDRESHDPQFPNLLACGQNCRARHCTSHF